MTYQVLYRRFRPKRFDEVVGQSHIIPILKNQIQSGNVSHAYLFSGPRGTGKTSVAKIFAKAVNCTNPDHGEACNKCESCLAEQNNALSNIIEIDAASNRGIDEIRQLKENVNFMPSNAKYRIYIIDEVHMLTTEAFNALLKTLEEPPAHVIFIFATTEVHKILPTILSRCQRFDFKRVSSSDIKQRLSYVLEQVGVSFEPSALDIIADAADGGMRDALSIADKVIASLNGETLTDEIVQKMLGLMGQDDIFKICEAICDSNPSDAFTSLNEAIQSGTDVEYIIDGLTDYFRNLMIYTSVSDSGRILLKGEKYIESLKRSAINVNSELLVSYVTELSKIRADGRYISNLRYLLEAAILKLCDSDRLSDYLSLQSRVDKLESRIEALMQKGYTITPTNSMLSAKPTFESVSNEAVGNVSEPDKQEQTATHSETLPQTDKDTLVKMHELLEFASKYILNTTRDIMLSGIVADMKVASFDGNNLYLYPVGSSVHMMDAFDARMGKDKLKNIFEAKLNKPINVVITTAPKNTKKKPTLIESAMEIMGEMQEIKE